MKVNCQQHRESLELLSLKTKLEKGIHDPEELKKVKERIRILEEDLKMN